MYRRSGAPESDAARGGPIAPMPSIETIDMMISRAQDNAGQNNASRLLMDAILALLKREKDRRAKAACIKRDAPGRHVHHTVSDRGR